MTYEMKRPIETYEQALDEGVAWGEYYAGNGPKPVYPCRDRTMLEYPRFSLTELRELRDVLARTRHWIGPVGLSNDATDQWRKASHWVDRLESLIAEYEEHESWLAAASLSEEQSE